MVADVGSSGSATGKLTSFSRGSNQSGMRAYNERLVLSLLRREGSLAKSDITRITGLSAQTISVIMRSLEADGLIMRGEPVRVRGKVGQPSVPMSLNPEGALFFGLKIGRRSFNLVLIDFLGTIIDSVDLSYRYPTPSETLSFARDSMRSMLAKLSPSRRERIAGLGISMPFEMWNWVEKIGAPKALMDEWRTADVCAEIANDFDFPVYLQNDATAACGAEQVFGQGAEFQEFIYFYIGYFIGGGLVLNGSLFTGRRGNAGAFGSMPITGRDGEARQLIEVASLSTLENEIKNSGQGDAHFYEQPAHWNIDHTAVDAWIDNAGRAIAQAMVSTMAVIEYDAALIDGSIPAKVRAAIVESVRYHLKRMDLAGIQEPVVQEGKIGPQARELGAACIPLSERFLVDQNSFLK